MSSYEDIAKVEVDPELKLQKATAEFACLCGKREVSCDAPAETEMFSLYLPRDAIW